MIKDLRIAVIADDFTGAMDTGVMFVNFGLHTEFHLSSEQSSSDISVVVVSTNSREQDLQSAISSIEHTAPLLENRRLFKKIDSTMRGHISAEIDALLQVTGLEKALICPTAVEAGRTVHDGILFVYGTPLHETAFAKDPHYPASTSILQELISHLSSIHIELDRLATGAEEVLDIIRQTDAKLISFDAISNEDLASISKIAIDGNYLPCGSMGLASAWIKRLLDSESEGNTLPNVSHNSDKPFLIVAGSRHAITSTQIEALIQYIPTYVVEISESLQQSAVFIELISKCNQHDIIILRTPTTKVNNQTSIDRIYELMRDIVHQLSSETKIAGMILIGGETAYNVFQSLGATSIRILGEVEPGVPIGQIIGGCATSLPIVTKAGGFGTDTTLCHVVDWLKTQGRK